jgi:16S rRNA (cytosine967-C5)-methyltransferase
VSGEVSVGLAPRRAAWRLLELVSQGRPFDQALTETLRSLPEADRRLAHELAAGTLRSAAVLDAAIAPHVRGGWDRVPHSIRNVLRLGAYQLTGLDRIPVHAAVSTTVTLAREVAGERTAGFTNAVLRKVATDAPRVVPGRASHPGWLVSRWTSRYGPEQAARLMAWNDTRPRLVIQPARWDRERLLEAWRAAGVGFEDAPFGAGLLPLEVTRPQELPGYSEGGFFVQESAQALVVLGFDVPPGSVIYDAAAAPGGKTLALGRTARMVAAGDLRRDRVRRLRENLERAGSGREHPLVADGTAPPIRNADAVVLDAPCLGTGVLARHPEARWRVNTDALERLVRESRALLDALAGSVRPGGLLCFSTCSLEPEENELQIEAFLQSQPTFRRDPSPRVPSELLTPAGDLALLPQRHGTDGAFAARLRRVA